MLLFNPYHKGVKMRKEYYEEHKEEINAKNKAYYQAHREEQKAKRKTWYQLHKEEQKLRNRAWKESHKDYNKEYSKEYYNTHKKELIESSVAYNKVDVNSSGIPKKNIRRQSQRYLSKNGTKIPGYEIHHCCTYNEPYKFIYCSRELHKLIHVYLRQQNIDADSNHYEQIKHLLDDTVVLYGIDKD